MTLLFNLLMLPVDLAALGLLRTARAPSVWLMAMCFAGAGATTLSGLLGENWFGVYRLEAYGRFLHGPILLAGSAALLWRNHRKTAWITAIGAAVVLAVAADAFLVEPHWLEVSHVEIASPKLKRPVRIVVLADIQTDRIGAYEEGVLRLALQQNPDLVLLAGDYLQPGMRVDDVWTEREQQQQALNDLLRRLDFSAPLGVFAVQGNIELPQWEQMFGGLKVITASTSKSFDLGVLRLTCLGLSESYDTMLRLPASEPGRFHIVLGHVPNFSLGHVEADLLLAGHTHGGQVRLPWIGPLSTHCEIPHAWAAGLTELDGGRKLVVSRGIGMERDTAPRFRFLCRPELVVIDLVPAN